MYQRDNAAKRRVLFVSYYFPPVGGAGVQRVTKFVKYLPGCGWEPSVLTVSNPSVPVLDGELLADVHAGTRVVGARTLEPSYRHKRGIAAGTSEKATLKGILRRLASFGLQPDPQILWVPDAIRQGMRLLRQTPHHAIVASAPPFSSFLAAAGLSRRTGLPLVLDYRDEWTISRTYWEHKTKDPISARLQCGMQASLLRRASALVATSPSSAATLELLRRDAGGVAPVTCIYNGFDPADFTRAAQLPPAVEGRSTRVRLAYVGTVWNLTSLEPFVGMVMQLAHDRPDLVARLEIVLAGRRTPEQEPWVARLHQLGCRVIDLPYVSHSQAIALMTSSDALLVSLAGVPGAERVVPAKLFEYMAARRPVLAVAPQGELTSLLTSHPAAICVEPSHVSAGAEALRRLIESGGSLREAFNEWDPSVFARPAQARQLADVLDACCGVPDRLAGAA